MRILYLASGEKQIYPFFDKIITKELNNSGHSVHSILQINNPSKIREAIFSFQPEVILTLAGLRLQDELVNWIRTQGIKLAVWLTEDPYYIDITSSSAQLYDIIFSIDSAAADVYKKLGHPRCHYLALGTEPAIFHPEAAIKEEFKSDICLVGYPYSNRIELIKLLTTKTRNYRCKIIGRGWENLLPPSSRKGRVELIDKWLPPVKVSQYYNGASIVLNPHRPFNEALNKNELKIAPSGVNNRTFDIAGCGSFQLIEKRNDLTMHFQEGDEIVSYEGSGDLLTKIDYFMNQSVKRKTIADNARKRVLKEHTFTHRIADILRLCADR